jgi:transcriptional regulator of heat shock response
MAHDGIYVTAREFQNLFDLHVSMQNKMDEAHTSMQEKIDEVSGRVEKKIDNMVQEMHEWQKEMGNQLQPIFDQRTAQVINTADTDRKDQKRQFKWERLGVIAALGGTIVAIFTTLFYGK